MPEESCLLSPASTLPGRAITNTFAMEPFLCWPALTCSRGMSMLWWLSGTGAVVKPDLTVIDGPFAESKELVGGYSIVEASDLAAACELAKQTMKLAGGGKIEVREFANVGQ